MIVPFPPGSASDFLARSVGQKLNEPVSNTTPNHHDESGGGGE